MRQLIRFFGLFLLRRTWGITLQIKRTLETPAAAPFSESPAPCRPLPRPTSKWLSRFKLLILQCSGLIPAVVPSGAAQVIRNPAARRAPSANQVLIVWCLFYQIIIKQIVHYLKIIWWLFDWIFQWLFDWLFASDWPSSSSYFVYLIDHLKSNNQQLIQIMHI